MVKEMSEKEKAKLQRQAALNNLNGNIANLAAVHTIHSSGQYGEAVNSAVEQTIYLPAVSLGLGYLNPETGEKGSIIAEGLISSRKNGRYSGNIDEKYILENAKNIAVGSIARARVSDVFELMGAKEKYSDKFVRNLKGLVGKGKDAYKDLTVADLKEKQMQTVAGMYLGWLANSRAAIALDATAKTMPGRLEAMLSGEEEIPEVTQ